MKDYLKKIKWDSILIALLTIVLGILCVALPTGTGDIMCLVFGIYLIITGAALLIRFFWVDRFLGANLIVLSVVMIIAGIFCLVYPQLMKSFITVMFGVYIIIDSLSSLVDSIYCCKARVPGWWLLTLLSILTTGLGVAVMFSTFETVVIFAGWSLIISGLERLIFTIFYSAKIKQAKKKVFKTFKYDGNDSIDMTDGNDSIE